MSRLGKLPIELKGGAKASFEGDTLTVTGPKGELTQKINSSVIINITPEQIEVSIKEGLSKKDKALWGLFRNLVKNMVLGVTAGFEKKLEIKGVGYRAQVQGQKLLLNLGFSHQVDFPLAKGITATVEGNTITIAGTDKQVVGEMAAQIRKIRKPEPYKGKGVKYVDEIIRRKAGKAAGAK